jgi:hypothetical protein
MMSGQPKGKPVGFDTMKVGKTLIRLNNGNYLELTLNVLKLLKGEGVNPDGTPVYMAHTNVAIAYWSKEEMAQMEE